MDKILFRAKALNTGKWVYGYYFAWHSKFKKNKYVAFIHVVKMEKGLKRLDEMIEVEPTTLQKRFTISPKGIGLYEDCITE